MTDSKEPLPTGVTSLFDRLPHERQARHLATLALREKVQSRAELDVLVNLAASLSTFDADSALAVLEQAPADFPDLADAKVASRAMRGAQRYLRGDVEGAFRDWAEAIEEHPEDAASAHLMRSEFLALRDYTEASRLAPTEVLYVTARAMAHNALGDAAGLRADLDAVMALRLTAPELRLQHARLLAHEGSFERALSHFDAAQALGINLPDAGRAELLYDRAKAMIYFDDYTAALNDLNQALALEPDSGEAFYQRSRCKGPLGDEQGAREDLEHAAALEWPDALQDLDPQSL